MLTDVKAWLEDTGMKVEEEQFPKPPPLPYILFNEDIDVSGADNKNCIANRNVTIELYSGKIDKIAESKIEVLLNKKSIQYKKNREWIDSERFFQTIYDFELIEKI